jgi:hypothetical protein
VPDRTYFIIGGELHRVVQRQLTLKRDGLPLLSETEVTELIQKDMALLLATAPDGTPLVKYGKDETPEIVVEDTIALAHVWMREVLPQIVPVSIELKIGPEDGLRLPESGTPVRCVIDLIDADACIVDLKSSTSKWSDGDAEKRLQTIIYSWAFRVLYGMPPGAFRYDVLIRKKRCKSRTTAKAEYQPIRFTPEPLLEFGALRRFEAIVEQMRLERYYPITGSQCHDCPFEEFCGRHFASLPFASCPATAPSAPAEGPRHLCAGKTDRNLPTVKEKP